MAEIALRSEKNNRTVLKDVIRLNRGAYAIKY